MEETTTIKVTKKTRDIIEERKIHPRQTNEEVIQEALSISGAHLTKTGGEE
jgi:hypothetical protein